jgi:hypothetical protein
VLLPRGLGVGLPHQDRAITGEHAAALGASWYYDWGYGPAVRHPLLWPAFWEPQNQPRAAWEQVAGWAADGKAPLVCNEPDGNGHDPAEIAHAMREWAAPFIGFGTIINDAGMAWLDRYLDARGPMPNAWHIHIYPFGS